MAFKLTNTVDADSIVSNRRGRAPLTVYSEMAESFFELFQADPNQVVHLDRSDPQLVEAFGSEENVPETSSLYFSLNRAVERLASVDFPNLRLQRWNMANKSVVTARCTNSKKRILPPRKKKVAPESQETETSETPETAESAP